MSVDFVSFRNFSRPLSTLQNNCVVGHDYTVARCQKEKSTKEFEKKRIFPSAFVSKCLKLSSIKLFTPMTMIMTSDLLTVVYYYS